MKGSLQKKVEASSLACRGCHWFEDKDADIFYCELEREEFPALCAEYVQFKKYADVRVDWTVPDEL